MTKNDTERFEEFLYECFSNNQASMELRLSDEEITILERIYNRAHLRRLAGPESNDGKAWYEVTFS